MSDPMSRPFPSLRTSRVVRVYFDPVDRVTHLKVHGVVTGVSPSVPPDVTLQPGCTPLMQRQQKNGCKSYDIPVSYPDEGGLTVKVDVNDSTDNTTLDTTDDLRFRTRQA